MAKSILGRLVDQVEKHCQREAKKEQKRQEAVRQLQLKRESERAQRLQQVVEQQKSRLKQTILRKRELLEECLLR